MKQINTYYPDEEQKILVETAAKIVGLRTASFAKSAAIKEALIILKENPEVISQ